MSVMELFTKRQKRLEQQGQPDVFVYDTIPEAFRVQVIHIWRDAIGPYNAWYNDDTQEPNAWWKLLHDALARERGVFNLGDRYNDVAAQCMQFLMTSDTDGVLDILELAFRLIDRGLREISEYKRSEVGIKLTPEEAIDELNERFFEHGIGYQYVEGEIQRVDSGYVHAEVVRPALALLHNAAFTGPSDEFLKAHEHYRKGRHKEAVVDALKAFESTMKAICDARQWAYDANATAKQLIQVMLDNGLIPAYLNSHLSGLRSVLEAGVPTVRNKTGGHGQGATPVAVPGYLVAYVLHVTAANIVLLVETHHTKP